MDPVTRPRLVTTVHGFYSVSRYSAIMTRGERVIAVSESVRDYILENYPEVESSRIQVIHRGVEPIEFPAGHRPTDTWKKQWYQDQPELKGRYVVSLPARLTRWKGQLLFIDLIKEIIAKGIDAHGLMVGGYDARRKGFVTELEEKIVNLDLADRITVLGHRDDVREVVAMSDAVVSMSTDPEAFGRTTLEALSMGVPVAGFDHGGVREQLKAILPEGLVPVGDVEHMVQTLINWRSRPPKIKPIGAFTQQAMISSVLSIYEEFMASQD
jgi:glycosyltransferase involved in cell wall biosynthesis